MPSDNQYSELINQTQSYVLVVSVSANREHIYSTIAAPNIHCIESSLNVKRFFTVARVCKVVLVKLCFLLTL